MPGIKSYVPSIKNTSDRSSTVAKAAGGCCAKGSQFDTCDNCKLPRVFPTKSTQLGHSESAVSRGVTE